MDEFYIHFLRSARPGYNVQPATIPVTQVGSSFMLLHSFVWGFWLPVRWTPGCLLHAPKGQEGGGLSALLPCAPSA